MLRVFLFSLLLAAGAVHASDWQQTCATVTTPVNYDYCVFKEKSSTNPDVIYHLHGAGEGQHVWMTGHMGKAMRDNWDTMKANPPTVVSVSFGPVWLLASKNSKQHSGLYETFTSSVMPYIEQTVLGGLKGTRAIFGYSMGGYNGSQLYLKNPTMFRRVVLGCPAMATISPYASDDEIKDYIKRNNAREDLVQFTLDVSRDHYADDKAYMMDSPLDLAKVNLKAGYPPLHISCGDADPFGFYEGASGFAQIAKNNGADVTWESLKGGHCVMDMDAVSAFLLK